MTRVWVGFNGSLQLYDLFKNLFILSMVKLSFSIEGDIIDDCLVKGYNSRDETKLYDKGYHLAMWLLESELHGTQIKKRKKSVVWESCKL